MKYRARILEIDPCSCDAEGEICAQLVTGRKIWFYYQGNREQAFLAFPPDALVDVTLVGKVSRAMITNRSESRFIQDNICRFEASGEISGMEHDEGETRYVLESAIRMVFESELGKAPLSVGDFVYVTGELWAEDYL